MGAEPARGGRIRSADGTELAWRRWPVPNPKARAAFAVVHGLGDHGGRYEAFATAMAGHGFDTFAIDLRGHGESSGRRGHIDSWSQWVQDASALVDLARREFDGPVIPLGHSFGGAVLLDALLNRAISTDRYALSSPALRLKVVPPAWKVTLGRAASRIAPRLAMGNEVNPQRISRRPEVVEAYRRDPLVHDRITSRTYTEWTEAATRIMAQARSIGVPFFVSHGDDDAIIDPEGTREFYRLAEVPGSEIHIYPGRYHEPFNDLRAEEVFTDLAAWASVPVP